MTNRVEICNEQCMKKNAILELELMQETRNISLAQRTKGIKVYDAYVIFKTEIFDICSLHANLVLSFPFVYYIQILLNLREQVCNLDQTAWNKFIFVLWISQCSATVHIRQLRNFLMIFYAIFQPFIQKFLCVKHEGSTYVLVCDRNHVWVSGTETNIKYWRRFGF